MRPNDLSLKKIPVSVAIIATLLGCSISTVAQSASPVSSLSSLIPLGLTESPKPGDLEIAAAGRAADIYVGKEDFQVARIAADCLATDVECITGAKPKIKNEARELSGAAVLIGTIGKSPLIDDL